MARRPGAADWRTISLAALAKIYDLDFHEAHHALEDAFVTARLWQKQILDAGVDLKIRSLGRRCCGRQGLIPHCRIKRYSPCPLPTDSVGTPFLRIRSFSAGTSAV